MLTQKNPDENLGDKWLSRLHRRQSKKTTYMTTLTGSNPSEDLDNITTPTTVEDSHDIVTCNPKVVIKVICCHLALSSTVGCTLGCWIVFIWCYHLGCHIGFQLGCHLGCHIGCHLCDYLCCQSNSCLGCHLDYHLCCHLG
jgi:hypothetical protein